MLIDTVLATSRPSTRFPSSLTGSALTLVIVPVTYHTLDELSEAFHRFAGRRRSPEEGPAASA